MDNFENMLNSEANTFHNPSNEFEGETLADAWRNDVETILDLKCE